MAFFSFTRQPRRRRVIFSALLSAAIACGFLGVSSTQLRAQADSSGGDLILLKDAAHVQMNGNQPAYDETGLPIGLDSTADAPIGNFKVGDWVIYARDGGTEVKYEGQEFQILSSRDVLAVVER